MSKTIFAPITSPNPAAVTVIRISGPKTKDCLEYLGVKKNLIPRQVLVKNIIDPSSNEILDQALISFFPKPNSFTGEDVAEISIHGSNYIIKRINELLSRIEDVRIAEPGEFSKIAFLNQKIDLVQAEAIIDLIAAETKEQHRQALRQMQGKLGKIYQNWTDELVKIAANIEAFIDFPDEDLPKNIIDDLESRVRNLIKQIQDHLQDNKRGENIRNGLYLTIFGKPNVGKSSLINYLTKSNVAIVAKTAGTTRDVIESRIIIADIPVTIADTAGIRTTKNSIEKEGVIRAINKIKEADLKLLILDAKKISENFDEELLKNFIYDSGNSLIIINKIDLGNFTIPKSLQDLEPILISLKEKIGLEKLAKILEEKVKIMTMPGSHPLITRARYREALNKTVANLENFSLDKNIEFAAEDLRLAIREIGKITGQVMAEDILSVIFSGFCIGK